MPCLLEQSSRQVDWPTNRTLLRAAMGLPGRHLRFWRLQITALPAAAWSAGKHAGWPLADDIAMIGDISMEL